MSKPLPEAVEANLRAWGTWLRAAGRPETTIQLRTYHVRRALSGIGLDPLTLTADDLIEYLGAQLWAPETRRSYRASLRGFFGWLQATGRRQDNPAALIPSIRLPRRVPRPTPDAIYRQALLDADDRVRLMIQLAAICGLRRGEISRTRREDVIRDVLGELELLVRGKGGHERMVPLPADLARTLLEMPPGWIFPTSSPMRAGQALSPKYVGKLVSRVLPDGWTCHTLRHRCGTVAYASTRDLRAVQELLGHAKSETTDLYTKVPAGAVRAAMMAANL